jgi:hypothetical protein
MRLVTASVMALMVATPLIAQEPQVQEREREHVVRPGDTLWDLAGRYFANPFQWRVIHQANTRVVDNPHWIYPDQVLVIPGQREMVEMAPDGPVAYQPRPAPPARTVFYREPPVRHGDGPTVLMDARLDRVPVRPAEFYSAEYLASELTLPVLAQVIRLERESESTIDLLVSAHPHDDLYLSYASTDRPSVGDRLVIVDVGREVQPSGRDVRLIYPRALVTVAELNREVMRVSIVEQFGRVVQGNLAVPMEFYPDFRAPAAEPVDGEPDLHGRIIVFVDESPMPNRMTRAFVDIGASHGVNVGDVFEAYLPERPAHQDGALMPEETVAELRVVRVTDTTATVVVDEITTLDLGPGIPVRRVRKMP